MPSSRMLSSSAAESAKPYTLYGLCVSPPKRLPREASGEGVGEASSTRPAAHNDPTQTAHSDHDDQEPQKYGPQKERIDLKQRPQEEREEGKPDAADEKEAPQLVHKTCSICRDNNPALIRQVLRERGYTVVESSTESDDDENAVHFQWAQTAVAVDFTKFQKNHVKVMNKNDNVNGTHPNSTGLLERFFTTNRFVNQLHGVKITTKEGMLSAIERQHMWPPWFFPTFEAADLLKKCGTSSSNKHNNKRSDEIQQLLQAPHPWIYKTQTRNRGQGIELFPTLSELVCHLKGKKKAAGASSNSSTTRGPASGANTSSSKAVGGVVQRYLERPLLVDGTRKFDVRVFFLVARVRPFLAFIASPGKGFAYCKCCALPFKQVAAVDQATAVTKTHHEEHTSRSEREHQASPESHSGARTSKLEFLATHITNQGIQREFLGDSDYKQREHDMVLPLPEVLGGEGANQMGDFSKQTKDILRTLCAVIQQQAATYVGTFQLFGCDVVLDEEGKVFLLEVNRNPALHTNCATLRDMLPRLVRETVRLVEGAHARNVADSSTSSASTFPVLKSDVFDVVYDEEQEQAEAQVTPLGSSCSARKHDQKQNTAIISDVDNVLDEQNLSHPRSCSQQHPRPQEDGVIEDKPVLAVNVPPARASYTTQPNLLLHERDRLVVLAATKRECSKDGREEFGRSSPLHAHQHDTSALGEPSILISLNASKRISEISIDGREFQQQLEGEVERHNTSVIAEKAETCKAQQSSGRGRPAIVPKLNVPAAAGGGGRVSSTVEQHAPGVGTARSSIVSMRGRAPKRSIAELSTTYHTRLGGAGAAAVPGGRMSAPGGGGSLGGPVVDCVSRSCHLASDVDFKQREQEYIKNTARRCRSGSSPGALVTIEDMYLKRRISKLQPTPVPEAPDDYPHGASGDITQLLHHEDPCIPRLQASPPFAATGDSFSCKTLRNTEDEPVALLASPAALFGLPTGGTAHHSEHSARTALAKVCSQKIVPGSSRPRGQPLPTQQQINSNLPLAGRSSAASCASTLITTARGQNRIKAGASSTGDQQHAPMQRPPPIVGIAEQIEDVKRAMAKAQEDASEAAASAEDILTAKRALGQLATILRQLERELAEERFRVEERQMRKEFQEVARKKLDANPSASPPSNRILNMRGTSRRLQPPPTSSSVVGQHQQLVGEGLFARPNQVGTCANGSATGPGGPVFPHRETHASHRPDVARAKGGLEASGISSSVAHPTRSSSAASGPRSSFSQKAFCERWRRKEVRERLSATRIPQIMEEFPHLKLEFNALLDWAFTSTVSPPAKRLTSWIARAALARAKRREQRKRQNSDVAANINNKHDENVIPREQETSSVFLPIPQPAVEEHEHQIDGDEQDDVEETEESKLNRPPLPHDLVSDFRRLTWLAELLFRRGRSEGETSCRALLGLRDVSSCLYVFGDPATTRDSDKNSVWSWSLGDYVYEGDHQLYALASQSAGHWADMRPGDLVFSESAPSEGACKSRMQVGVYLGPHRETISCSTSKNKFEVLSSFDELESHSTTGTRIECQHHFRSLEPWLGETGPTATPVLATNNLLAPPQQLEQFGIEGGGMQEEVFRMNEEIGQIRTPRSLEKRTLNLVEDLSSDEKMYF
ncbi:unnamed protein product [Amoebophrya sp. A25]|nr:unnamed protein product [Amoebophrya sp. A25]|eukprot:GSA25T00000169001.1